MTPNNSHCESLPDPAETAHSIQPSEGNRRLVAELRAACTCSDQMTPCDADRIVAALKRDGLAMVRPEIGCGRRVSPETYASGRRHAPPFAEPAADRPSMGLVAPEAGAA
jgi:hypothetical protein